MSVINIENVKNIIKGLTFDEIKVIMEGLDVKVRECKNEELKNLYLLISENTVDPTELQIECNGLIIEKETNKIVCMCQNQMLSFENAINENMQAEYCEDGTVIRYFNYNDNWYTATTKCIDAKKSYWSSTKTFNDMFFELFDRELNLSKENTYIFIVKHIENRIVVKHQLNELVFVVSINNETQCQHQHQDLDFKTPTVLTIEKGKSLEDYYNPNKRGLIIKIDNKLYKYDFKEYTKVKDIRGNIPLIKMRYLELIKNPEQLSLLEKYYPNALLFAMIKHCLCTLYKNVHKLYIDSHVKHNCMITKSHPLFQTCKQLHGFYKKTGNIITLDQVQEKINSLEPNVIKKLLNWVN